MNFGSLLSFSRVAFTASVGFIALSGFSGAAGVDSGRLYEVGRARLYVETSGAGPPIVFLHGGLSFFERSFAGQKSYFSTFRTVIGIDQRGHGHSPDNEQPFSYRQMADDTATLIRQLNLGPVDVVGHSDGGNVGLLLARYHPGLVRRLVISGANIRGDFGGIAQYIRNRWMSAEKFTAGLSSSLRRDYARVSPDGERHWPAMATKTKELWSTWVVLRPEDLSAIQIPVLVMAGDHDLIPLEHTIEIFRGLPKGQLCILPGSGHDTMKERPEEFNRLTREFLEEPAVR